jgi:hypothetical protein
MKKGSPIKFWTISEDNALRTCITKFKTDVEAAKWAAEKFDRTVSSVYQRITFIKQGKEFTYREQKAEKTPVKKTKSNEGVVIPAGFTFDIAPKRAVMYTDHVRLYF